GDIRGNWRPIIIGTKSLFGRCRDIFEKDVFMRNISVPKFRRVVSSAIALCCCLTALLALMPAAVFSQSCTPAPSSLISSWPGEGNANDTAGLNPGVLNGGVTFPAGEVGQAFN